MATKTVQELEAELREVHERFAAGDERALGKEFDIAGLLDAAGVPPREVYCRMPVAIENFRRILDSTDVDDLRSNFDLVDEVLEEMASWGITHPVLDPLVLKFVLCGYSRIDTWAFAASQYSKDEHVVAEARRRVLDNFTDAWFVGLSSNEQDHVVEKFRERITEDEAKIFRAHIERWMKFRFDDHRDSTGRIDEAEQLMNAAYESARFLGETLLVRREDALDDRLSRARRGGASA